MNHKWLICVRLFAAGLPARALSGSEYLKATSQVGGIVSTTAADMPDDMSLGTAVCHRRAELDYAQHRVELPRVAIFEWSSGTEWGAFYGAQSVDGTSADTWETQCKVFENADALFKKAMKTLGEYGAALTKLADSGAYDGKDVQGDMKSAGDLATVLGASNAIGKDLSSVGAPLAQIARLLAMALDRSGLDRRACPVGAGDNFIGTRHGWHRCVWGLMVVGATRFRLFWRGVKKKEEESDDPKNNSLVVSRCCGCVIGINGMVQDASRSDTSHGGSLYWRLGLLLQRSR